MEKYYTFLTLDEEKKLNELCEGDEILMDVIDKLKIMSNDSGLITDLEQDQIDEYCRMLALEQKFDDGKEVGFSEGKTIGLSEGKTIRNIEIVKKSLEQGIDIETISTITGLTIKEINKLKEETTL